MPLDTIYSVGEGRAVVVAVDGCSNCLNAFEEFLRERQQPEDRIVAVIRGGKGRGIQGRFSGPLLISGAARSRGKQKAQQAQEKANRGEAPDAPSDAPPRLGFASSLLGGAGRGAAQGQEVGSDACASSDTEGELCPPSDKCKVRNRVVIPGKPLSDFSDWDSASRGVLTKLLGRAEKFRTRFEAIRVFAGSRPHQFAESVMECCAELEASLLVVGSHSNGSSDSASNSSSISSGGGAGTGGATHGRTLSAVFSLNTACPVLVLGKRKAAVDDSALPSGAHREKGPLRMSQSSLFRSASFLGMSATHKLDDFPDPNSARVARLSRALKDAKVPLLLDAPAVEACSTSSAAKDVQGLEGYTGAGAAEEAAGSLPHHKDREGRKIREGAAPEIGGAAPIPKGAEGQEDKRREGTTSKSQVVLPSPTGADPSLSSPKGVEKGGTKRREFPAPGLEGEPRSPKGADLALPSPKGAQKGQSKRQEFTTPGLEGEPPSPKGANLALPSSKGRGGVKGAKKLDRTKVARGADAHSDLPSPASPGAKAKGGALPAFQLPVFLRQGLSSEAGQVQKDEGQREKDKSKKEKEEGQRDRDHGTAAKKPTAAPHAKKLPTRSRQDPKQQNFGEKMRKFATRVQVSMMS